MRPASASGTGDRIVTGANGSDDWNAFPYPQWWPPERRAAAPRDMKQLVFTKYRQSVVDMIFETETDRPTYTHLKPYPTREQMIRDLPPEVLDMTVSCGNPKFIDGQWVPCGQHSGFQFYLYEEDRKGQCFKCSILSRWLPRYRYDNGWIARGL